MKFFPLLFLSFSVFAQQKYSIKVDIKNIKNDKVKVEIQTPKTTEDVVEYVMPAVIPGTYAKKDYGRFVVDFKAYSENGKKLKVKKIGDNVFQIANNKPSKLSKIEYLIDDTWDVKSKKPKKGKPDDDGNYIFQPGGTNIEAGKNVVLNHFGFYGYIEGMKMLPYEVTVTKPDNFFGSSPLDISRINASTDKFQSENYVKLVDNPVLYCVADTASFMAGDAKVVVAVYSETGVVKADTIRKQVTPLATALAKFFTKMPTDKYYFLMYFPSYTNNTIAANGGFGALEHSYCSFYFLPEMLGEQLESMVLSVASHEFLHILTPLNVHSEEIENFDYRNPKMSEHLWMYEGCTEYFANLVQVRDSLMSFEKFLSQIQSKIIQATQYPLVSFIEMSKHVIEAEYKDMYNNVYEKGALIGFLLDIRLNELSDGKMNLRDLIMKLKERYGPSKPFRDEELFSVITELSYPEIGNFLDTYVAGATPLPYAEYMDKIGLSYYTMKMDSALGFGNYGMSFDEKKNEFFIYQADTNLFALKQNDVIKKVNGTEITMQNFNNVLPPMFDAKTMDEVTLEVNRNGKPLVLKSKPQMLTTQQTNVVEENKNATEKQKILRQKLLYGK